MAYAQVSDITGVAPGVEITNTSRPTAGQVTTMIADLARELDAQLANLGYVTPIVEATSPKAFAIVKKKVAHGVLAQVLRARAFGATEPKAQGADAAEKVYTDWLKALANPNDPTELPDATRTGEAVEKDGADRIGSHVQGLTTEELDGDAPRVTMRQVF